MFARQPRLLWLGGVSASSPDGFRRPSKSSAASVLVTHVTCFSAGSRGGAEGNPERQARSPKEGSAEPRVEAFGHDSFDPRHGHTTENLHQTFLKTLQGEALPSLIDAMMGHLQDIMLDSWSTLGGRNLCLLL
ncbi:unnamed protein product [Arctogadus glacialis]